MFQPCHPLLTVLIYFLVDFGVHPRGICQQLCSLCLHANTAFLFPLLPTAEDLCYPDSHCTFLLVKPSFSVRVSLHPRCLLPLHLYMSVLLLNGQTSPNHSEPSHFPLQSFFLLAVGCGGVIECGLTKRQQSRQQGGLRVWALPVVRKITQLYSQHGVIFFFLTQFLVLCPLRMTTSKAGLLPSPWTKVSPAFCVRCYIHISIYVCQ